MSHHHHARGITVPGASRKRKEMDSGFLCYSQYKPMIAQPAAKPDLSNWLLAGCMAHEFLTNGTLFGQKLDPGRPGAATVAMAAAPLVCERDPLWKPEGEPKLGAEPGVKKAHQSYADVACVLKTDGSHVPGVVNPTQLARWIQM